MRGHVGGRQAELLELLCDPATGNPLVRVDDTLVDRSAGTRFVPAMVGVFTRGNTDTEVVVGDIGGSFIVLWLDLGDFERGARRNRRVG